MAKQREITGVTEHGEVVKAIQLSSKSKYVPTEPFIAIYLKDTLDLMSLLQHAEIKLLHCLWKDCVYSNEKAEGNIVHTNVFYKNKWADAINVRITTVNTLLCKLEKKDFIKRLGTSVYILNPEYFYKGDRNSRFLVKEKFQGLFKQEQEEKSNNHFNYTKQEE